MTTLDIEGRAPWKCVGVVAMVAALLSANAEAGPYAPRAGISGSTALIKTDSRIVGWATSVVSGTPGPMAIDTPTAGNATWGWSTGATAALGPANADPDVNSDTYPVV